MGGWGLDLEGVKERHRELLKEAERERLLRALRAPWRKRLACWLRLLAERLEPKPTGWAMEEVRHGG